jgi:hypothetical protein
LHQQLEGEEIPIGDILEMDIPLAMFFDGTIPRTPMHIVGKTFRTSHAHDIFFLVWLGIFSTLTNTTKRI